VVWIRGLSRTNHGNVLHQECRKLALPWLDSDRIPHPRSLLARIAQLRLVDALLRRLERIRQIMHNSTGGAE
jgi:hypothetical protein